jgi:hypothetical protein
MPSGRIPGSAVRDLAGRLLNLDPAALNDFAKANGKSFQLDIVDGIYTALEEGGTPKGRFPGENLAISDPYIQRNVLLQYLQGKGAPLGREDLDSWMTATEAMNLGEVGRAACESYASLKPDQAEQLLKEGGKHVDQVGLLNGVSKHDAGRAAKIAAEIDDSGGLLSQYFTPWLEENSTAASSWLSDLDESSLRNSAIGVMIKWLREKGSDEEAEKWSRALK